MRLYHSYSYWSRVFRFGDEVRSDWSFFLFRSWAVLLIYLLAGCSGPQATQSEMTVKVMVDAQSVEVTVPPGSTVQGALDAAGIEVGKLDRVEPLPYTLLTQGAEIKVIRVSEEYTVEQEVIPFERQVLKTESLPEEETLLAQSGENGLQEITYRHVYEDGIEVSKNPVKRIVAKEAIPEIVMVGIQPPFAPITIPGRLVYLLGGNAWMMEQNTGNRRAIITSGDLDGRILSLSPQSDWLLFTRSSSEEDEINTLWAADLESDPVELYDLGISNVIHFADWVPNAISKRIVYSTVEPRDSAPGWQANNDLNVISFSESGWVSQQGVYVDPNVGGIYGWWGTDYEWSPDGSQLAYVRSDGLGLVDLEEGSLLSMHEVIPVKTRGDWSWVPGLSWAPDGNFIYTVDHVAQTGSLLPEESPQFDLTAIRLNGEAIHIKPQTGMFAYPACSPMESETEEGKNYKIAYLQAIFPNQSETSRYQLMIMDRDGSNQRLLFPRPGEPGVDPQQVVWSPSQLSDREGFAIAFVYQGNLWLVDAIEGIPRQVTGDGLASRITWR